MKLFWNFEIFLRLFLCFSEFSLKIETLLKLKLSWNFEGLLNFCWKFHGNVVFGIWNLFNSYFNVITSPLCLSTFNILCINKLILLFLLLLTYFLLTSPLFLRQNLSKFNRKFEKIGLNWHNIPKNYSFGFGLVSQCTYQ